MNSLEEDLVEILGERGALQLRRQLLKILGNAGPAGPSIGGMQHHPWDCWTSTR